MTTLRERAAQAAQERDEAYEARMIEEERAANVMMAHRAVETVEKRLDVTATPDYETGTAVVDDLFFVQPQYNGALYLWRDGQTNGFPIWTVDGLHDALTYVPPDPAPPDPPAPPSIEESLARIAEALEEIGDKLDGIRYTFQSTEGDGIADVLYYGLKKQR